MMRTGLTQSDYIDPSVFEQEQRRIFRRLWLFAGIASVVSEPDSFLTRELGGIPVVIQNFGGELKAFENQCAHRQMPLQLEPYGQRRLACRYHGWTYRADGGLKSLPDPHIYDFSLAERDALGLKRLALERIGQLLFVNLDPDPLPIDRQFSPALQDQLRSISGHFSNQLIHAPMPLKYNWKLNFENVLDWNHVAHVHPRTFRPLMRTNPAARPSENEEGTPDVGVATLDAGPVRLVDLSYASQTPLAVAAQPWHAFVDRYVGGDDPDTYYNFFLYPNVNFISVGGLVFLVQQFNPLAPDRTQVDFTLMTARETRRLNALPAILWGHMKGEKRILDEDRIVLESLQARLYDGGGAAVLGRHESVLNRVGTVYRELMEAA